MSGLFGGSKPAPAPAPKPVTVMPDPEDPAILAARRREQMANAARSGRASTILSSDYSDDKLGTR
ncbi:hypothetical protein [Enterovirga sp. CN4-39]|uniref:hypothetical protein n=1 Tax=Enterovirga sp. CN4-39 TaxID=3400910 RepID=UPI003C122476